MTKRSSARDLREACVGEALTIISERGLEALSMRDVARRLGVSHQAPYKHFESRDHIIAEIVATAFEEFADHLDSRSRCDDPFDDLGGMGMAYLEYAEREPLKYRLMFGSQLPDADRHARMVERGQHAFSLLVDAISRIHKHMGQERTRERIEMDAMFVWSTVHGMATLRQTEPQRKLDLCARTNKEMIGHALRMIGEALRAAG